MTIILRSCEDVYTHTHTHTHIYIYIGPIRFDELDRKRHGLKNYGKKLYARIKYKGPNR
jgi:hypothetical protein